MEKKSFNEINNRIMGKQDSLRLSIITQKNDMAP